MYTCMQKLSRTLLLLQEEALLLPSASPLFILHSICGGQDSPPDYISLGPTCVLRTKVLLLQYRLLYNSITGWRRYRVNIAISAGCPEMPLVGGCFHTQVP